MQHLLQTHVRDCRRDTTAMYTINFRSGYTSLVGMKVEMDFRRSQALQEKRAGRI